MPAQPSEHRVELDFEITFRNGGGLQGQGFRLDIPGDDISDVDAGALLVQELGLLMVDQVRITARRILVEPHRRRAVAAGAGADVDRLIELSHPIRDGLVTYPGLPAPVITDHLSREASRKVYAPGTEFQIGRIDMVANTGTYVDAPFHRFAEGKDLAELPLTSLADLDGVVVRHDLARGRAIGPEAFDGVALAGRAVLVATGWSSRWDTPAYFDGHPYLTAEAAELLRNARAALVGIDSLNIDDTADLRRPVHTALLGAEIPVAEHLTGLERLPDAGFRFFAVPVKVRALGTFPVRAFALVDR